jgi:chromosome segregation ATPase
VKDTHDQDAAIGVSLETLVRQISEISRNEIAALRTTLDRQISSIESRLDPRNQQAAIDGAVRTIARLAGDRIDHSRQQAEAAMAQALAANTMLRTALSNAQQQLETAQTAVAAAEADRKSMASQQREALNERNRLAAALEKSQAQLLDFHSQLKKSQQGTQELTVERFELQRKLKDAIAAKAAAESQYQQLVIASQKLTDGLSQTLHREVEQVRAISAPRKPLQFAEKARDAKRVKIRRGTQVSMDGIPGELVDMSLGGAQVVLRQSVKPNQLVRLVLPTAVGQLICKGRIVWALFEQPGTSLSVYRAGVKFADTDPAAVEAFMNDFRDESFMVSRRSSETA